MRLPATINSILLLFVVTSYCAADIVDIDPFSGEASENFDSFQSGTGNLSPMDAFSGDVTLVSGAGGSVKIEMSSTRGGDTVIPRSSQNFVGHFEVTEWIFHRPILQFGGYFENNSRFDDIVVEFYGGNNQLLGTRTAIAPIDAQAWTWNGWQSDDPIHRITTAGNDVVFQHGFVWYDDMEISFAPVPEPSTGGILCLMATSFLVRRRRSRA